MSNCIQRQYINKLRKSASLTKEALLPLSELMKFWGWAGKLFPKVNEISNINKSLQHISINRSRWRNPQFRNWYNNSLDDKTRALFKQLYTNKRHELFDSIRNNLNPKNNPGKGVKSGTSTQWNTGSATYNTSANPGNLPARQSNTYALQAYNPAPNWTYGGNSNTGSTWAYNQKPRARFKGKQETPGWAKFIYGVSTPILIGQGFIRPDLAQQ